MRPPPLGRVSARSAWTGASWLAAALRSQQFLVRRYRKITCSPLVKFEAAFPPTASRCQAWKNRVNVEVKGVQRTKVLEHARGSAVIIFGKVPCDERLLRYGAGSRGALGRCVG